MSPDTPLTEQGFLSEPDALTQTDTLSAELAALKARNRQLEKINAALIERVESSSPSPSAPYAAFEHAVLLADQVRERTDALHRTLDELGALNRRLTAAKAAAEAANHSKTRFLAAISHDLLQPLNAARLFASALEEQLALDASLPGDAISDIMPGDASQGISTPGELVARLGRSLADVERLLGTLVDISRLDAGVLTADVAVFPVRELLDVLAEEYRQLGAARGLELHYVASHLSIESDLQLLARVVRNFLSNALRHVPDGSMRGRVLLGCRRRGDWLEITVADNGPGIAEHQREVVFQEFRRLAPRQDNEQRGLGLGLAIVKRITGLLEHPLSLTSTPGRGAAFAVRVPIRQPASVVGSAADASSPGPPCASPLAQPLLDTVIWVVEDDREVCAGMQSLLGGWGASVYCADDAEVLLQQAVTAPQVLIVDHQLGEGQPDGLKQAQRLQQRWPGLPVVVISADHSAPLKARARALGFGFLLKPVKPLRLRQLLVNCR
ncbi:MAG: hybrid sensor histidine kinase/response regulator [Cobetia sp.]|jgi:signal transduction histidine kinase|uniref:ATP-binding response regulator n=1 Tax=Cobetia sp. TaxID=1873876 RepID=UPI000C520142|nr:hybrid sensor histidine kinase/response regulator [Cobetia sp.]MBF08805.1 hybrid sensor histidine kinase/response regulator [Cobetia sp.]HAR07943.1 hybrid sensor histidine kinase/response regulator [Cobetia sp.]|tara:strand:- start:875 stop:2368 length:1494 start_codon:yes stop_codon:yes gene_type:complete